MTNGNIFRQVVPLSRLRRALGPLEPGVYLHITDDQATEVLVTGIAQAGTVVLLVG